MPITDIKTIDLNDIDVIVVHGKITQSELLSIIDNVKELPGYNNQLLIYGDVRDLAVLKEDEMKEYGWCRCDNSS